MHDSLSEDGNAAHSVQECAVLIDNPLSVGSVIKSMSGSVASCESPKLFNMCLVQFNVLSLLDPGGNLPSGFRDQSLREILAQDVFDAGVTFCGLQEARSPMSAFESEHFVHIASGSENGNFGCELWAQKEISFPRPSGSSIVNISVDHFVAIISEPRILLVSFNCAALRLNFLVFHAPVGARGS